MDHTNHENNMLNWLIRNGEGIVMYSCQTWRCGYTVTPHPPRITRSPPIPKAGQLPIKGSTASSCPCPCPYPPASSLMAWHHITSPGANPACGSAAVVSNAAGCNAQARDEGMTGRAYGDLDRVIVEGGPARYLSPTLAKPSSGERLADRLGFP